MAADALSDVGGDGGVCMSEAIDDTDLAGGVATVGDVESVSIGDISEALDPGRARSVVMVCDGRSLDLARASSACLSFPCLISASTLRSESSSRSRCVSILNSSRSFSLTLISSSSMTFRSIETLNFDSKSSKEDVVCRACVS